MSTLTGYEHGMYSLMFLTNEPLATFEGYDPRDVSIGVEASPNAANASWAGSVVTLSGVPDYRDFASALLSNWRCQQDVRIINSAAGSATRMVPDRSPSTTSTTAPAHGGRVFHRVNVQVLTTEGDGIEGARLYISDTDNGARVDTVTADTANNPIDESGGRTYSAASDADGNFPVQEVMTAQWYRTNVVNDIDTPDENEIVDVRGKTNTAGTDDFDIQLAGYGYRFTQLFDQVFNGTTNYTRSVFLEPDPLVTESDTSVVEAYTTLENARKWYDHVKYEATGTDYAGAQSIYCTRDGDTLNVGSTSLVLQVGDGVGDPSSRWTRRCDHSRRRCNIHRQHHHDRGNHSQRWRGSRRINTGRQWTDSHHHWTSARTQRGRGRMASLARCYGQTEHYHGTGR